MTAATCLASLILTAPHPTDWFAAAGYGVFAHLLPGDPASLAKVEAFDVEAVAEQLSAMGAGYFVLTLGQNSGYFNSPNATYDRITGYAAGERCSRRDLPAELADALARRDIRLMLYLPCQTPNRDAKAQRAFGLPEGPRDQPLDDAFAAQWAAVIQDWSDRYGERVAGWWFDGGYQHIHFNAAIAQVYAAAVKHGNPKAIVSFNPGVKLIKYMPSEDYTAGELNEPFEQVPDGRFVDGSQWHALTYVGSRWGGRDTRHPAAQWASWVKSVVEREGVVTLDMGPNWDANAGPIGTFATAQVEQMIAVREAVRG